MESAGPACLQVKLLSLIRCLRLKELKSYISSDTTKQISYCPLIISLINLSISHLKTTFKAGKQCEVLKLFFHFILCGCNVPNPFIAVALYIVKNDGYYTKDENSEMTTYSVSLLLICFSYLYFVYNLCNLRQKDKI